MAKLKFTRRPSPVLPEHRPLYKIAQIMLILQFSRGHKSSVLRLHLFNWALKSAQRIQFLRSAVKDGALPLPTWGFDPALAIALRYALAEQLVEQVANGFRLTDKGAAFINDALKDSEVFVQERVDLAEVCKQITETMVERVAKDWN